MAIIYSRTNNTNSTGWSGYAIRVTTQGLTGSGTGTQWNRVRATFEAASTGNNFKTDHVSIGISSPDSSGVINTASTPIELLFSGASGFNLSPGQTITSDWATLVFAWTDYVTIDMDMNAGVSVDLRANSNSNDYWKAATADYNHASVSGYTFGLSYGLQSIEAVAIVPYNPIPQLGPTLAQ